MKFNAPCVWGRKSVNRNPDTNSHLQQENTGKSASRQVLHIIVSVEILMIFIEERRLLMEVYIRHPAVCQCSWVIDGRRHAPFTGQAGTRRNLHLLFQNSHKTPHRENWSVSTRERSAKVRTSHADLQTLWVWLCTQVYLHTHTQRTRTGSHLYWGTQAGLSNCRIAHNLKAWSHMHNYAHKHPIFVIQFVSACWRCLSVKSSRQNPKNLDFWI